MKWDEGYDNEKSIFTKEKRGIDFLEARKVWDDENAIEGPGTLKNGEERWLKVGMIKGKLWTVVFIYRNSKIRILSVRRARNEEKKAYFE